jgi:hypothetical protein
MVEELGLPYTSSQRERSSIRIFSTPSSEAILFIVDNEKFLRIEEKDTGAHTPPTHISDAVSLAIWSNSKNGPAAAESPNSDVNILLSSDDIIHAK